MGELFQGIFVRKRLPNIENLTNRQLAEILYHFYIEVHKKKIEDK